MPETAKHAEPFTLAYGLEYDGRRHYHGAIRVPTVLDREIALEETPENASNARVDRHVWARTLVRLGDIPTDAITPDLLATLVDADYGPIRDAEDCAKKKLLPAKEEPED